MSWLNRSYSREDVASLRELGISKENAKLALEVFGFIQPTCAAWGTDGAPSDPWLRSCSVRAGRETQRQHLYVLFQALTACPSNRECPLPRGGHAHALSKPRARPSGFRPEAAAGLLATPLYVTAPSPAPPPARRAPFRARALSFFSRRPRLTHADHPSSLCRRFRSKQPPRPR